MNKTSIFEESLTDWDRLDAMQDEDIDLSDIPEITPEMFAKAVVRRGLKQPPPKQQITIRLDDDVLRWFRAQGDGYQTRINALLRAYMDAHQTEPADAHLGMRTPPTPVH
ncbi:MAG: BrnA antitoxin family protein [Anaerolineae bacterium]|mgnify:CR=1 FL=1|jgi:uncharacterized protein (DUF4415 family)